MVVVSLLVVLVVFVPSSLVVWVVVVVESVVELVTVIVDVIVSEAYCPTNHRTAQDAIYDGRNSKGYDKRRCSSESCCHCQCA